MPVPSSPTHLESDSGPRGAVCGIESPRWHRRESSCQTTAFHVCSMTLMSDAAVRLVGRFTLGKSRRAALKPSRQAEKGRVEKRKQWCLTLIISSFALWRRLALILPETKLVSGFLVSVGQPFHRRPIEIRTALGVELRTGVNAVRRLAGVSRLQLPDRKRGSQLSNRSRQFRTFSARSTGM